MTRETNRITLCAIAALYVAVSRACAEQTCSLADENARGAVETALRRGLGWRRVGDACKLDRSKVDDDAWTRRECVAVDAWARDVVKELIRD